MIGDRPVAAAEIVHKVRDLPQRLPAIAPVGMIMQRPPQFGPFEQARNLPFFARGEFALILADFGWDEREVEGLKNLLFGSARHQQRRVAGFLFAAKKAIFVQAQPALDRALAHDDVVLLAPGEIGKRKWKLSVTHDPQVGLNSALENDTRLGVSLGADAQHSEQLNKVVQHARRRFRRNEKVDVADDLLTTAHAASGAAAYDIFQGAQSFENRFRDVNRIAKQMT